MSKKDRSGKKDVAVHMHVLYGHTHVHMFWDVFGCHVHCKPATQPPVLVGTLENQDVRTCSW